MSDSEEENLATFGVPLDPLDEESLPRKRAATIENQYAYDAQGRRRFHGAFTGGFSAGYFNTVGTRDGWRPQQFKSSRGNKAKNVEQQPEDFMDEEDVSIFGIAPKGIRACKDYEDHGQRGTKRDRTKLLNNTIPGNPILKELLRPVKETVGIVLLKKMGWKPGQGVGNRVTKKAKMKARQNTEQIKVYGCSLQQEQQKLVDSDSEDTDDENTSITFAPDDYEPFQCNAKDNYFGIGYSGLNKQNVLSNQLNLIDVPEFHVHVNSKKIPIYGQAFGVGAFEAEDEDIYQEEDMSRYDIMLGSECKTKSRWSQDNSSSKKEIDCLEGFQPAQSKMDRRKRFVSPELPKDFKAVHLVRRSRFYPPILRKSYSSRKEELNAVDRARILKDIDPTSNVSREHLVTDSSTDRNTSVICNIVSKTLNLPRKSSIIEKQNLETQGAKKEVSWMDKLRSEKFTKGGIVGSELEKGVKGSNSATTSVKTEGEIIKPFLSDSDKQNRFEQFCNFPVDDRSKRLDVIQPLSMSEWDRNNEYTEFVQAERLLRPASSNVENKFVASTVPSVATTATEVANISSNQMEDAAKIEMFGTLTREKIEWKPSSIVCKRFNVPQPKSGCAEPETNKVTHFSVFGSILDSSMDDKFLKSTDTPFTKAENETSVLSTNIVSNLSEDSNVDAKDTTSIDDGEKSDILSQKIKHFETSYEKIFGKTIDNASAANVKDSKQNHSYDGKNEGNHANEDLENLSNLEKETETTSAVVTVADKNSEEKKDLFKAIFLSSSDESEAELENDIDVSEVVKSVLIGETSSEIKPQKNTSPPRGIFAKLDLDDLMVQSRDITKQPMENTIQGSQDMDVVVKTEPEVLVHSDNGNKDYNNTMEISNPSGMYGPVLPSRLIKNESTSATEESNSESSKSAFKSVVIPKIKDKQQQYGRWVEQRKSKKSKKEKRKHKHKEHKSPKHKKRSKKDKR